MAVVGVFQPLSSRSAQMLISPHVQILSEMKSLTNWCALLKIGKVGREALNLLAVEALIANTNLERLKRVENIELGQVLQRISCCSSRTRD